MTWNGKQSVVVPVDFSPASIAAVDAAREFVTDGSHLHVIHVLPALSANDPAVLWGGVTEEAAREHVEQKFGELLSSARYDGHSEEIAFGSVPGEICTYAEKVGADLIVLPSHGESGIRRLLIGSVAERVVRHAHCPVLVLRD